MKNIIVLKILGEKIFYNTHNSMFSKCIDDTRMFSKLDLYSYINDFKITSITLCVNISNTCNLRCDYCFNKVKNGEYFDIDMVKTTILYFIEKYNECEKYFVDLSGKGEPLIFLKRILEINDFCKKISNKINKEILVSFVTNGVLLTPKVASILQNNSILFGISIDGNKIIHDKHRKDLFENGTYNVIMNNIYNIKNRDYIGCAVTLTNDVFSLVDSLKELSQYFRTISYKPVRDKYLGFNSKSLAKWIKEYELLTLFIYDTFKRNDLFFIKILLNGDDYFGKFIFRCLMNHKTLNRCDAGITRFAINGDGKIYDCSPLSVFEHNYSYLDPHKNLKKQIDRLLMKCKKCVFKLICGGECEVVYKTHNKNDKIMCKFKLTLIRYSIFLTCVSKEVLSRNKYLELISFCNEKTNREHMDKKLANFLNNHKEYSFVDGKKIFDSLNKRY